MRTVERPQTVLRGASTLFRNKAPKICEPDTHGLWADFKLGRKCSCHFFGRTVRRLFPVLSQLLINPIGRHQQGGRKLVGSNFLWVYRSATVLIPSKDRSVNEHLSFVL